ncbi:PAS domain S-box protein [Roseomonas indoligenes]|uniref:histidine kinase n=1 Tax=Roseomonas indoligenes TaxID=2820811 RepID=A0A940S9U5_9PROT|nr:PAS domain S-box protein [Pararoseomonas indoligenes]MBP0495658.1 PAS domain S-box protein [Pararoseomonas indoligenes]
MPLLSRLLILVGIALLPALGALFWGAQEEHHTREAAARDEVLRTVRLMAADHQRIADGARQLLTSLGNLRAVRALDAAECQSFFARIMQDFPRYVVLATATPDGQVVCSADPSAVGNGVADRDYFRRALAGGGFVTGGFVVGRSSGQGSFHFSQPFRDTTGAVAGVVHAGIGLDWLAEQVNRVPLPPHSVLSIIDRDGVVLASRPGRGQTVGEKVRGSVTGLVGRENEGVEDRIGSDGRRRIYGYIPVGVTGTHMIVVGLDRAALLSQASAAERRGAMILSGTILLALLLTVVGARRLVREPVGRLLAASERWRRGDTAARITVAPRKSGEGSEFDRLASAFNAMAETAEARERSLRESEEANARLAAIVTSAADAIISLSPADGTIMSWNQGAESLFGYVPEEVLGRQIDLLLPPEDEAGPLFRRALSGGTTRDHEAVRVAKDGSRIPVSITLAAMRGGDGRVIGVSVILRDLRERRAADQHQQLLMREVDHRARNVMSVVRSLVQLSPKEDPKAFARAIEGRISAMARAHGLLAQDRWEGGSLRVLAEGELGIPADGPPQAELEGPAVTLRPDAVQPLSMVLHELVTNSRKYGALSREGGVVGLRWWAEPAGSEGDLVIRWTERGGPPVDAPPARKGFGSRLIEISVRHQLRGTFAQDWQRTGLVATIRIGAACIAAIAPGAGPPPPALPDPGPAPGPKGLAGLRVLVVEDEALVAVEVADALAAAGCRIIGPAGTLEDGLAAARGAGAIDAAVLDMKLGGHPVLPLADELAARGVPIVFTTGYGEPPPGHREAVVLTKPVRPEDLVRAVQQLVARTLVQP